MISLKWNPQKGFGMKSKSKKQTFWIYFTAYVLVYEMPETTPYHFELAFGPSTAKQQLEKIAQHSTMMKMLSRVVILPRPSFKPLTESCGKLALGDIIIKNFCVRNSNFEIPHDYHIFSGSLTVQTKCLSGM